MLKKTFSSLLFASIFCLSLGAQVQANAGSAASQPVNAQNAQAQDRAYAQSVLDETLDSKTQPSSKEPAAEQTKTPTESPLRPDPKDGGAAYAQALVDAARNAYIPPPETKAEQDQAQASSSLAGTLATSGTSSQPLEAPTIIFSQVIFWCLVVFGAFLYLNMWADRKTELLAHPRVETELVGIKGWLTFFVIMLALVTPAFNFSHASMSFYDTEMKTPALTRVENWIYLKYASLLLYGAVAGLQVYAGLRLKFVWKPSSVTLAKVALCTSPFALFMNALVFPAIFFSGVEVIDAGASANQFLVSLAWAAIWISYLSFSKRVKATYYSSPAQPLQNHASGNQTTWHRETKRVHDLQKNTSLPAIPPEHFWEAALEEFDSDDRRKGIWARAYALAQGDEARAKASYLETRANEMQREHLASV